VIPFLKSETVKTGKIYGGMTVQNADNRFGQRKANEYVERVK